MPTLPNVAGLVSRSIVQRTNNNWKGNYGSIREVSKNVRDSTNALLTKREAQMVALKSYIKSLNDTVRMYSNVRITNEELMMADLHPQYSHRIVMKNYINSVKPVVIKAKNAIRSAIRKGDYNAGHKQYKNIMNDIQKAASRAVSV